LNVAALKVFVPIVLVFITACAALVRPAPEPEPPPPAASTPPAAKSVAKAEAPATKPAAKAPVAASKPAAAPPKLESPAALDLKTLEQQLRETKAIGVMTKLSIKNQVDDLIERFRAYYQGQLKTTLADLRRPYEMLLMKVLAIVQDADPALAKKINASREAIWGILADRDKFARAAS
jgi:hypothetical protein